MVGVPCFTRCVPGPSSRICLPMPSQRSNRRNGGMRMTTQAKASSSPWMNSTPCSFTDLLVLRLATMRLGGNPHESTSRPAH